MAKKFYLDTSIWRDYFEDRRDNIRPLGEFAFQFLRKCQLRKDIVFVSNEIVKELLAYYSEERVKQVFADFKDIIVDIGYGKEEVAEANSVWLKSNKKFPFSDILHSIIARNNEAILISRDKHFTELGIVKCSLPEETD